VVVKPGAAAVCWTARGGCNTAYSRVPRDSAAHAVRGPAVRLLWCWYRVAAAAAAAAALAAQRFASRLTREKGVLQKEFM
jgi:hypothetical protein